MAKQDEKDYYSRLETGGRLHAEGKPFTDAERGRLLIEIGQVMALLPPAPARLLDVGCGTGWTSEFFARSGYAVTGLDISLDMLRAAGGCRNRDHLAFVAADFENMPFSKQFDVVVSFGSLHHCDDLSSALVGCKRALSPGGTLILMEPGEGHSESPTSLEFSKHYGLTERSLPPDLLRSTLSSLGYQQIRIVPWLSMFPAALPSTQSQRSWKYRLASLLLGRSLADSLQFMRQTKKCAVVVASV